MTILRVGTGSGKLVKDSQSGSSVYANAAYTVGNALILPFSFNDNANTVSNVTTADNLAAWTTVRSAKSSGGNMAAIAYRLNCPSGITAITTTYVGAGTCFAVGSQDQYSGINAQDQTNTAVGSSNPTPLATGSITDAATTDLVIACWASDDGNVGTWSGTAASAPWTTLHNEGDTNSHHASFAAFLIDTATGTFNPTAGYNVETVQAAGVILSFSASGGVVAASLMGSMRMVMP